MRRFILMLTVAAIMTAMMMGSAMPAQAKTVCHVLDLIDWWVVTGQVSQYGGTYCHNH